jgi:hypothetical protein
VVFDLHRHVGVDLGRRVRRDASGLRRALLEEVALIPGEVPLLPVSSVTRRLDLVRLTRIDHKLRHPAETLERLKHLL